MKTIQPDSAGLQQRVLSMVETEGEASAFGLAARLFPQVCGLVPTCCVQDVLAALTALEAEGRVRAERRAAAGWRAGFFTRFRPGLRLAA